MSAIVRITTKLASLGALLLSAAALAASLYATEEWNEQELATLSSLRLSGLPAPPADPSNRVEGVPQAIALGKQLFFDARLSRDGKVSCASCHDPGRQFQDGRPVAQGVGTGIRRTMTAVDAGHSPFLFWDGRKDSLWSQAVGPLEDPAEHGGNRLAYAHFMQAHYRAQYEAVFGAMPDFSGLPAEASPIGTARQQATWRQLDDAARKEVTRVLANIGKAIAAYEKTLHYGESKMDRYVDAVIARDPGAGQMLTPGEKNGLRLFIGKGQCVTCHSGPLLTDQHFHNTGIAPHGSAPHTLGRRNGAARVLADEFNCLGYFSDALAAQCQELQFIATDDPLLDGAFKTPGLRNVALRPPYMHAGQIASLDDVLQHYRTAPRARVGRSELRPIHLTDQEMRDIVAFLHTLSGPVIEAADKGRSAIAAHP